MVKFQSLLLLLVVAYSCNHEKHIRHYWVSYNSREYEKSDTSQIIEFSKSYKNDTTILFYRGTDGYTNYFILDQKDNSFFISNPRDSLLHPKDNVVHLRMMRDTTFVLKFDTLNVREYIFDEWIQDGAGIIYFEPSLGIFAAHSDTWPGISYLQSDDSAMNNMVYMLIKSTVPKFFVRGKLDSFLRHHFNTIKQYDPKLRVPAVDRSITPPNIHA